MENFKYLYSENGVTETSTYSTIKYPLVNGNVYERQEKGHSFDCDTDKKMTLFHEKELSQILSLISLDEFKSILDKLPLYPILTEISSICGGMGKELSKEELQEEAIKCHAIPYEMNILSSYVPESRTFKNKYSYEGFSLSMLTLGQYIIPEILKLRNIETDKKLVFIFDFDSIYVHTPILDKNKHELSVSVNLKDLLSKNINNFKDSVKKEVEKEMGSVKEFYAPFTLNGKEIPFEDVPKVLEKEFKVALKKVLRK